MRQPLDYKNGKIYVIRNHINNKVYVGATTQSLSKRFGEHKSSIKKKYPLYTEMTNIGIDNFYIELVENYPCNSKDELGAREGHYIRQFDSYNNGLNCKIEGRTIKTYYDENKEQKKLYSKQYREENKAKIADINKEYYEKNKDRVLNSNSKYYYKNKDEINVKITCECGVEITKRNLFRHAKSKIHQNYLSSITNSS